MNLPTPPKALLPRPPPRELFFAPLQVVFDPNTLEEVNFAYIASKYGHARQQRDDGMRYFDHPKGAAWIYIDELDGRDAAIIIIILMHDLSEDQYLLSPYRIARNFGPERALDIGAITKLPKGKETTEEYLGRVIARGPRVIVAKLCDRLHNNRTLSACPKPKQEKQVAETRVYLTILIPALKRHGGEWVDLANKLESKINQALSVFA